MLNKVIFISWVMLMVLFITLPVAYAAINPDLTPKWQVGDSWDTVIREMLGAELGVPGGDIERPGDPVYMHFKVVDLKDINGEMCYIVEITYKYPRWEFDRKAALQLYVRKDNFTLKKVVDGIREYRNGHDFVIFLDPFCITIPCDFPNFPSTNTNEERSIEHPKFGLMTQKITFMDNNTVEIELSTENNEGILKTTQIWEKGKPWWSSVKRTFTYKDITKPGHPEVTRVENDNLLVGTDLTSPELGVTVNPPVLWPPNHKMVEIIPTIVVTDDYDRYPEVKVYSVESNEPDDLPGEGDGHTAQDIEITEDGKIYLRAERDGKGDGRIYTITYSATDFSGNTSTSSAIVTVPHDKGEEKKK